ncbi:MAG: sensor histidine kinase [Pseudomarimonas sp.]
MSVSPPRQIAPTVGLSFERRLLLDACLLLLPLLACAVLLVWLHWPPSTGVWLAMATALLLTLALTLRLRQRVIYPLYTLSNLLEALREGDYSLRGSRARRGDAIGDVVWEINALSQTLREQRLKVEETSALLGKVIAAIDIALFSFDDGRRLRLLNPAAERLLGKRAGEALGQHATALGLEEALESSGASVLDRTFAGGSGRFEVRRFSFREGGLPLELLAITDLSRALREEERQAWQRLIRVLSHELNNSLAPIKSMAGTLSSMLTVDPPPIDWREDAQLGMRVIADRAEALSRFMIGYATLARLPSPRKQRLDLRALLQRVTTLEQRMTVRLVAGPPLQLLADPDQLEQALINLLKNAVEASLPESGEVSVKAQQSAAEIRIEIIDCGLGLAGSDNLFVPFFTTKPGGSGIGLVLARQIVEAHGGQLNLENRLDARGCVATIRLPMGAE